VNHSRYYVEIRDVDGGEPELTGYICSDGRFIVEYDRDLPTGTVLSAAEIADEGVVTVSYNMRGELRSVAERKHIAAFAERHGFRIARGARANLIPGDFRRLRPPPPPCAHEDLLWNMSSDTRRRPYRCRTCPATFREGEVVIADGRLQLVTSAHTWRGPSMAAT
jgi:hypothetical protein